MSLALASSRKRGAPSTNASPSITVTLKKDDDEVAGDDECAEYSGDEDPVDTYAAKIRRGSEIVGEASLILVDREAASRGDHGDFYGVCDFSIELNDAFKFLCDRQGRPHRSTSICGHDAVSCFLFIEQFTFFPAHRPNTDGDGDWTREGAEAIRAILGHPALRNKHTGEPFWSLAVYVPDSRAWMTESEVESARSDSEIVKRVCRKDARQFFRAGFRQVTPPSLRYKNNHQDGNHYHLFAVPKFVDGGREMISHSDAVSVAVVDPPEHRPPSGIDLQIRSAVQQELQAGLPMMITSGDPPPRHPDGFEATIRDLVRRGGSIERSFAIHDCAERGKLGVLDLLLRMVGDSSLRAINARDEEGFTPLMKAQEAALIDPSKAVICNELIARGALGGAGATWQGLNSYI